jgi:hypothetical protein
MPLTNLNEISPTASSAIPTLHIFAGEAGQLAILPRAPKSSSTEARHACRRALA